MTRNGKIARLPWSLRDNLNRRLRDGEFGKALVDWLNSLPEVQQVLREEFGGRSINEQNLSEWKQGGYEDWVRHQETRTWVQDWAGQAADIRRDINEEAGDLSLVELLSTRVAIALSRSLYSSVAKASDDPKQTRILLDIAGELARLRRDDHSQRCLAIQRERWETDLKLKLQRMMSKSGQSQNYYELFIQTLVEMRTDAVRKRYAEKKKRGSLTAEEDAHYQEALAKLAKWREDPREARANKHVLIAGAGSLDPEPFQ